MHACLTQELAGVAVEREGGGGACVRKAGGEQPAERAMQDLQHILYSTMWWQHELHNRIDGVVLLAALYAMHPCRLEALSVAVTPTLKRCLRSARPGRSDAHAAGKGLVQLAISCGCTSLTVPMNKVRTRGSEEPLKIGDCV